LQKQVLKGNLTKNLYALCDFFGEAFPDILIDLKKKTLQSYEKLRFSLNKKIVKEHSLRKSVLSCQTLQTNFWAPIEIGIAEIVLMSFLCFRHNDIQKTVQYVPSFIHCLCRIVIELKMRRVKARKSVLEFPKFNDDSNFVAVLQNDHNDKYKNEK
jgi:hypothetical protein